MNIEERIIKVLKDSGWGLTSSEIAERANISRLTASKYLEALKERGVVIEKKVGAYRLWFLKEFIKAEKSLISKKLACALAQAFVDVFKESAADIATKIGKSLVNQIRSSEEFKGFFTIQTINQNPYEIIASILELLSEGIRAEGIELSEGRGVLKIIGEMCEEQEVVEVLGNILKGAVEGILKEMFNKEYKSVYLSISKKVDIYEIIIEVQ